MMTAEVVGVLVTNGSRDVSDTQQQPPSYRPLPVSTVQLAGQTTDQVVGGLAKSPIMLGVVVINLIGIVAAVYFLNLLIAGQQKLFTELLNVQQEHLKEILGGQGVQYKALLDMHNREFDAFVDMNSKGSPATAPPRPPEAERRAR